MSTINIKLVKDKKLFLPSNMVLMETDKVYTVQKTTFWTRRLNDGDVTLVKKSNSSAQKPTNTN